MSENCQDDKYRQRCGGYKHNCKLNRNPHWDGCWGVINYEPNACRRIVENGCSSRYFRFHEPDRYRFEHEDGTIEQHERGTLGYEQVVYELLNRQKAPDKMPSGWIWSDGHEEP
jgi:hypothetical protein